MAIAVDNWAEQIRAGDVRAISRGITAIENHAPEAEEILRQLFPSTGQAYLVGVTGTPGTGKSTLVDRLAAHYRRQQQTVGIVAVDPTSPFTGGAILGDRIRMQGHHADSGIFIRSMATRAAPWAGWRAPPPTWPPCWTPPERKWWWWRPWAWARTR